ncbi:autotransporter outer membrane beta-barrel domain-containing protein [Mesorhizobium sp.]|uniref:autotransporter outer membrane beta-barrel domain-containing protein n=1 Tax=Mesorhizobium sp. TaxID=1871066 RepID=UPI003BABD269
MKSYRSARLAALLLAGTAFAGLPVSSANAIETWTGTASTNWFTAGNWSTDATPTSGDTVMIDTTTPNIATINGGNANSDILQIGTTGTGALSILNGGVLNNTGAALLGISTSGDGTATVSGANSTWNVNDDTLSVGFRGTGSLTIQNGGQVNAAFASVGEMGGTGAVSVDGAGSDWTIQNGLGLGQGSLTITDGGAVTVNSDFELGNRSGLTGTTTVDGTGSSLDAKGDLSIGVAGGIGGLTIQNGGLVSDENGYVGNQASGNGTVVVAGAGSTWTNSTALVVGGDLTTGGTGALTIENGGTVSNGATAIGYAADSNGSVTVTGTGSFLYSTGNLQVGYLGRGTLTIANGGAVTDLTANIGFATGTGTVTVDGIHSSWSNTGDLYIGTGTGGSGTLAISNSAGVSVDGNLYLSYALGSTGTLNIGAAPGSAAVGAGTLDAASVQFGAGTGTINFNHDSANYVFAPAISGFGTINQIAGTTNLITDSSGFTGSTNITGGELAVYASLSGSLVTVSGGGILGGTGVVGGINAHSGGIIAPGDGIGTLNVAGNVAQASGSTYQVELDSTGSSDLLKATGTATIDGGARIDVVKLDAAPYVVGTHYMVLEADSGVTGTYTLTGDLGTAFLGLTDSYDADHVYLDVVQRTFAQVGQTPNQIATGGGAESLGSGNSLYDAIVVLPTVAAAQDAFDQLSGEIHASTKGMLLEDSHFIRDAATSRIDAAFGDAGVAALPVMAYGDGGPEIVAADTDRFALWGQAFGSWGNMDGDGNAAAFSRSTGGLLVGADTLVGGWRVGALGGYSHSSFDVDDRNAAGSSDNYHVGLYGGTNWGALAFRTGAAYSWSSISTKRSVVFNGFADALSAGYDAGTAQAFGELAYKVEANRFRFEPFANLAYVDVRTGAFTETGGAATLTSTGTSTNATFTTLGLRGSTDFALGGIDATARGTLGWRHAFGDVTPTSTLAFAGGDAFTIAGVPIARDTAVVEAGLDLKMSANATLGVSYDGQFGGRAADNGAKANLNVRF